MSDILDEAVYGSREELLRRLTECLSFARVTVESADPAHRLWKVDLGQVSGFEKMMMEAGLLAYIIDRAGYCETEVHDLARTIRAKYDSTSAVSCILRHPRLAASLGTLLLVLDRFGLATPQEIAAVHSAFESPYVECSEHVPFRLLDRRWVLELAKGPGAPLDEAIRLSTACRTTHPIYMSREDGYAITHTIMYATDFGARPAPDALHGEPLWDTIDASIAWCTAAADFDLLAEFLLSQIYLRGHFSAYGALAWRESRAIWDRLGFLPSPSLSAQSFLSHTAEPEQRQYAFHNMYHTVLVGGLLCAACLDLQAAPVHALGSAPSYVPPASVERALAGAADHLERVLGVDRSAARDAIAAIEWNADEAALDELVDLWAVNGSSGPLAERMAIDASIILAAQEYELSRLAAALRRAGRTRTVTTTVNAGADFLARQSLVNGAIGAGWLRSSADDPACDTVSSARVSAALANCLFGLGRQLAPGEAVS